jgi:hypothetical protein
MAVHLDAVLTYAVNGLEGASKGEVKRCLATFYTSDELTKAKAVLWDAGNQAIIGRSSTRQGTGKIERTAEDIVNALVLLSNAKEIPKFAIGPDLLHRIPNVKPHETLSVGVCQRLKCLEEEMELMKALFGRVEDIEGRLRRPSYNTVAARGPEAPIWAAVPRPPPPPPPTQPPMINPVPTSSTVVIPAERGPRPAAAMRDGSRQETAASSNSGDGYTTVNHRKKKPKRKLIGTKTGVSLKVAPTQYRSVFVSGFDTDTPAHEIADYVKQYHVEPRTVERQSRIGAPQASFRVEVKLDDFSKIYNSAFWPEPVLVDKFYNRPKRVDANRRQRNAPQPAEDDASQPPPLEGDGVDTPLPTEDETRIAEENQQNQNDVTHHHEASAAEETQAKSLWD